MEQVITRAQLRTMAENEPKRRRRIGEIVLRVSNEVINLARNGQYNCIFNHVDSDVVHEVYNQLVQMFPDSRVMSFGTGVRIDWS
jgi:hypothetical protein